MIDFLRLHWDEIFAAIGATYTAARLIVAITPTPKDDAAVAKIGAFVGTIAKLFGLNTKQGINK